MKNLLGLGSNRLTVGEVSGGSGRGGELRLESLSKRYAADAPAVDAISLSVKSGADCNSAKTKVGWSTAGNRSNDCWGRRESDRVFAALPWLMQVLQARQRLQSKVN